MYFPHAERFSAKEDWVPPIADKVGLAVPFRGFAQPSAPPSQLYEALFEGIVSGRSSGRSAIVGPSRASSSGCTYRLRHGPFVIEYFREPEPIWVTASNSSMTGSRRPYSSPFNFSTGQVLCALMSSPAYSGRDSGAPTSGILRGRPRTNPGPGADAARERREERAPQDAEKLGYGHARRPGRSITR
jgi:hypothetical protein